MASNGINSRLQDCLDVLTDIYMLARPDFVQCILFGGDLFHTRKRVDTAAYNAVHQVISKGRKRIYLLPGNHDQYDQLGRIHALQRFESPAKVIEGPCWYDLDNWVYLFAIPYMHDSQDFVDAVTEGIAQKPRDARFTIALFHVGVDGTKVGSGRYAYTLDSDVALTDLHPSEFDVVLLGHYHTPQQLASNVYYIGAPLQHGWADEGEDRGVMIVDTDTGDVKRIHLTDSPRFMTVQEGQAANARPQDFVRVAVEAKKKQIKRSGISLSLDRHEMLEEYVKTKGNKLPKLAKFGKRFV